MSKEQVLNFLPKIEIPFMPKKNVFEVRDRAEHERLGKLFDPGEVQAAADKMLYGEVVGMVGWCVKQGHGVDPPWMLRKFLGVPLGGWNGIWIGLFFIELLFFSISIKSALGLLVFEVLFSIAFFFLTSKYEHNHANHCLICGKEGENIHEEDGKLKAGKCATCSWVNARWSMWNTARDNRWDDIRDNPVDAKIPIWWSFKHKWLMIDYYAKDPLGLTSFKYTHNDKKSPRDILPIDVLKQLYEEQINNANTTKLVIEMMKKGEFA